MLGSAAAVVCVAVALRLCLRCILPRRQLKRCIICQADFKVVEVGNRKRRKGAAVMSDAWEAHRRHCAKLNWSALAGRFSAHPAGARCANCGERLRLLPAASAALAAAPAAFECAASAHGGGGANKGKSKKKNSKVKNDGTNCYRCYDCDVDYCAACADGGASSKSKSGANAKSGSSSYLQSRYGVSELPKSAKRSPRLPPSVTCNPLFSAVDVATDGSVSSACKRMLLLAERTGDAVAGVAAIGMMPAAVGGGGSTASSLNSSPKSGGSRHSSSANIAAAVAAGGGSGNANNLLRPKVSMMRRNSSAPNLFHAMVKDLPSSSASPSVCAYPKFVIPSSAARPRPPPCVP